MSEHRLGVGKKRSWVNSKALNIVSAIGESKRFTRMKKPLASILTLGLKEGLLWGMTELRSENPNITWCTFLLKCQNQATEHNR